MTSNASDVSGMIKRLPPALARIPDFMTIAATVAAAALALTLPAQTSFAADEKSEKSDEIVNNIYVSYSGGVAYIRNQNLSGADATGTDLSGNVESDMGFNVGGAIGMRFYEIFRAELELGYHRAETNSISVQNEPDNGKGYISLLSVMANGYVDYDLDIGIIPYVGVGVGWGRVELDAKNDNGVLRVDGSDNVFTWALMIGGSVPISEMIDLSVGYRYIATEDLELNSSVLRTGTTRDAERLDGEFDSHEGVVSIRYKF